MSEWIKVSERLPDKDEQEALVVVKKNVLRAVYYASYKGWIDEDGEWTEPTHWLPIPDVPKEDA